MFGQSQKAVNRISRAAHVGQVNVQRLALPSRSNQVLKSSGYLGGARPVPAEEAPQIHASRSLRVAPATPPLRASVGIPTYSSVCFGLPSRAPGPFPPVRSSWGLPSPLVTGRSSVPTGSPFDAARAGDFLDFLDSVLLGMKPPLRMEGSRDPLCSEKRSQRHLLGRSRFRARTRATAPGLRM